ncbi:glycosyltransferase family A protein [Congregibacter variabilis]|uniref:Glycosyltransferase family A protein n=1 Tax=Congregibacter variabilis TaxID=3081200 RepID=A0ABZ0I895_9GAMM|nr:glycosyltransferase family A protein [Congregibacter sp. IMCC43200]
MPNQTTVSFVIPHKGREQLLRETLLSIKAQQTTLLYDVQLVTQNTELAPETLALLETMPVFASYEDEALTISALRNRGAARSTAPCLAFLDADIGLAPDWLETVHRLLTQHSDYALVSAHQFCDSNGSPLEKVRTQLSNMQVDTDVRFLPGRNLFLHRSSFDAVGGFPEHLITCEDYWFTERVSKIGKLWYTTETQYEHFGEDRDHRAMFRKEIWRGQSNWASMGGRTIPLGEWPSFLVPPVLTLLTLTVPLLLLAGLTQTAAIVTLIVAACLCAYVLRVWQAGRGRISLLSVLRFYIYYFPARTLGTLAGIWPKLDTTTHQS